MFGASVVVLGLLFVINYFGLHVSEKIQMVISVIALAPLAIIILILGVFPNPILSLIGSSLEQLNNNILHYGLVALK